MKINDYIIINNVNIEETTSNKIVINVNGEQLLHDLYNELKLEFKEEDWDDYEMILKFQEYPFIKIYPNDIFSERDCSKILISIQEELNKQLRESLGVKE